jgi:hypothetical protein
MARVVARWMRQLRFRRKGGGGARAEEREAKRKKTKA